MASKFTDQFGRPIVAVTGIGVVTSLGQGKADNWAALTSGKSGIHAINRFPTNCRHGRFPARKRTGRIGAVAGAGFNGSGRSHC